MTLADRHLAILREVQDKFRNRTDLTEQERQRSLDFFDQIIAAVERGTDSLQALVGATANSQTERFDYLDR